VNEKNVSQIVKREVALTCAIPVEEVEDEGNLVGYNLDSVRIFELIVALETEFDTRIEDADLEGIKTVGDVIRIIERNLKA
jgi:acyl carrier protein